jgi:hypothetical protein
MSINIIAKFRNAPREDIGTFDVSILTFQSSGIILNNDKVNPLTVSDVNTKLNPSMGFIGVSDLGITEIVLSNSVTTTQLTDGYLINNVPCESDTLLIKSRGKCSNVEKANIFGVNGNPYVKLTLENIDSPTDSFTSNLILVPYDMNTHKSIPSEVTLTQTGIGSTSTNIKLFKGKYWFKYDIQNVNGTTNDLYKKTTLTFSQCGIDSFVQPTDTLPQVNTDIYEKWINDTSSPIENITYYSKSEQCLVSQTVDVDEIICVKKGTLSESCGELTYFGNCNDVELVVTPTVTPTSTVTPTITPTNTVTPTITPTITITPSITPSTSIGVTFSQTFTSGIAPGSTIENEWTTFRGQLTGTYTKFDFFSSNGQGYTGITDEVKVQQLADSIRTGTTGVNFSTVISGVTWNVGCCACRAGGAANGAVEFANVGLCSGASNAALRPWINNANWGGIGITVGAATQTLTLRFY